MEINPDLLPTGMHIVAAVEARSGNQTPANYESTSTLLLSSTGGLYLYHPNEVMSATIECGHVSDIRSFIDTPRQVSQPKRLFVWKVSVVYTFFLISLMWAVCGYLLFDQAVNGYSPVSATSSDGTVSSNDVAEGVIFGVVSLAFWVIPGFPYLYCIFKSFSVPKYVSPRTLFLKFEHAELTVCDTPEWAQAYSKIRTGFTLGLLFAAATLVPSAELVIFLTNIAVVILLMYSFVVGIVYLAKDDSTEIGELTTGNLSRFVRVIGDLHHQHREVEGEVDEDQHPLAVGTVRDRVGLHIQKPLEKLYSYEDDLNKLTNGEWEAMLTAEKFYFSLAQIRRCTEKMLYELTILHGIKIKSKNRGLTTMLQRLVQQDLLPANPIKWVEVIKAIANPAAHDMTENADDFISAFNAFVSFTSWYVEASRSNPMEEE